MCLFSSLKSGASALFQLAGAVWGSFIEARFFRGIGVKRLDAKGQVLGEQRFLGLFTSTAYASHPTDIPLEELSYKVEPQGMPPIYVHDFGHRAD